jgi:branched-chain amino acid transport system ATP-binding protein
VTALRISGLQKRFGGVLALDDVSLALAEGELHALIGPNGAGKTTLVHLLSGALQPTAGAIVLDGRDITGLSMHRRVRLGLARSYQITSVFPNFTALENLALAVQAARRGRDGADDRERARAELDAVGLGDRADELAGALAHGERRQLELGLALATGARILLLDEPMAGMGPEEAARIVGLIEGLKRRRTLLLVEHDMDAVFRLADRITALVYGRVIASGTPDEIRRHPDVRRAYLGDPEPPAQVSPLGRDVR